MNNDFCAGYSAGPSTTRGLILGWLAQGARDVTWALCSLPRERWAVEPPGSPGQWPALRHVRHLMLDETNLTLPAVRCVLGELPLESLPPRAERQRADAAWDAAEALASAEALVRNLGEVRFELLQRLEAAPDVDWERPLPSPLALAFGSHSQPARLEKLLLRAYAHQLEHLSAVWKLALYWDRSPPSIDRTVALSLQPAVRLEESH